MTFIDEREKVFKNLNDAAYLQQGSSDFIGYEHPYYDATEDESTVVLGVLGGLAVIGLAGASLIGGVVYGGSRLLRGIKNNTYPQNG